MTLLNDPRPISADSHALEGPEVFEGLAEKFGDDAPRIVSKSKEGKGDYIIIPNNPKRARNVAIMALAGTRLDYATPLPREHASKPAAGSIEDPEIQAYFTGGYAAMRAGLTDGARRPDDQDIDGVSAEILYPGWFSMFSLSQPRPHGRPATQLQQLDARSIRRIEGTSRRTGGLAGTATRGRRCRTRARHQTRLQRHRHPEQRSARPSLLRRSVRTDVGARRRGRSARRIPRRLHVTRSRLVESVCEPRSHCRLRRQPRTHPRHDGRTHGARCLREVSESEVCAG